MTRKFDNPVAVASIYDAVTALPDLTRSHKFHYLTYSVDEEQTYAVLVGKTGQIHTLEPVPAVMGNVEKANLAEHEIIQINDMAEAIQYRPRRLGI